MRLLLTAVALAMLAGCSSSGGDAQCEQGAPTPCNDEGQGVGSDVPAVDPTVSASRPAVPRNPDEACDVVAEWALADNLGVQGHDTPEDAAEDAARSYPEVPDGPWYVVLRKGNEAFLAPSQGPWRLEVVRTDDIGWYVVEGLTCAGEDPGPYAKPPLSNG
jgi:hypothetical protein